MTLIFWYPDSAPHDLGENLARAFGDAKPLSELAKGALGDVNLCYGILRGGEELHRLCRLMNKDFIHVDHGFWGRTGNLNSVKEGYFRFSLNSQVQRQVRAPTPKDFVRAELLVARGLFNLQARRGWRETDTILYQPPSSYMAAYYGLPGDFDAKQIAKLNADFPNAPVRQILKGERGVGSEVGMFVSFNSAAGLHALELGLEVRNTWVDSLWSNGMAALPDEDWKHSRSVLFCYLAGRTFDFIELRTGLAYEHMLDNQTIPR